MSDTESLQYDAEQDDLREYLHREGTCGGPDECSTCEDEEAIKLLDEQDEGAA
jgi:hypothetical protein